MSHGVLYCLSHLVKLLTVKIRVFEYGIMGMILARLKKIFVKQYENKATRHSETIFMSDYEELKKSPIFEEAVIILEKVIAVK